MKNLILLALFSFSSAAFANYCGVDMIDNRTNRVITSFSAYDYNDGCKEGMKECRLEIRNRGLLGRADCVRVADTHPQPIPQPWPTPQPIPQPVPLPQPWPESSYDAQRILRTGESVIHNNRYVNVIGVSMNGLYAVRANDSWNTVTNSVRRESLAVTSGCNQDLCTGNSVVHLSSSRIVKIIGLHTNDSFVIQANDSWSTITSNISRQGLAETRGCVSSRWSQLCVGHQVLDTSNRYATVIAIQLDGRVVLQINDSWNTIRTNVDPGNLVITR